MLDMFYFTVSLVTFILLCSLVLFAVSSRGGCGLLQEDSESSSCEATYQIVQVVMTPHYVRCGF